METLNHKVDSWLKDRGVDFVKFVDISDLSVEQTSGYQTAILFGLVLSPSYLKKVENTASYVKKMIANKEVETDEFHLCEKKTDQLADELAVFIRSLNFKAFSQSEKSILNAGKYNEKEKRTPLPHKTIAVKSGLGWIGKNNLLITKDYACSLSMCTVLTDAPLSYSKVNEDVTSCEECSLCVKVCKENALLNVNWSQNTDRDKIVDVYKCTTCLECMVHCKWTKRYLKNSFSLKN